MTKEDIIRMAHESGLCDANGEDDDSVNISAQIEHFAKLVAEAEREECARGCLETEPFYGQMFADAIRARGQQAEPVPPWYRQFCNCPKCSEAPKQAEPVQAEPVARVLQTVAQYYNGRFVAEVETIRKLRDGEPLYTHPQQQAESVATCFCGSPQILNTWHRKDAPCFAPQMAEPVVKLDAQSRHMHDLLDKLDKL